MLFFYSSGKSAYIGCIVLPNRLEFVRWLGMANEGHPSLFRDPLKEIPQSCMRKLYPNYEWFSGKYVVKPR